MVFPLRLAAVFVGTAVVCSPVHARDYRVTVAPLDVDRAGQVVTFQVPADAPRPAMLQAESGATYPVQRGADGSATFVVPAQAAGERLTLRLRAGTAAAPAAGVEVKKEKTRLHVTAGGRPLFDYQLDKEALPRADIKPEYKRAGYIHPVFTPAGKVVTDDYPSNHVHHHGIWTPWTKTKFQGRAPDFWNMGTKTGAEDLVGVDRTWGGPVHGGFEARLQMVDLSAPSPVVALHETWRVTAYQVPGAAVTMFDLELTQTCATKDPLELPNYHYGGFGFRGADAWNGPGDAALFLIPDGTTDRIKGNNARGHWCYLGGRIDGAIAGTAILGHPENFRAPQPMRLHHNMPYMSYVPQQLGAFAIEPGKPYVARFRFVAADGPPEKQRIEAYWNGYARAAAVTLEPAP